MTELNDKTIAVLQQQDTATYSKKRSQVRAILEDTPTKEIVESYMELLLEVVQGKNRNTKQSVEINKIPITQEQFDQMFRIIGADGRGRKPSKKNTELL